jgi:hypothetical protein
VREGALLVAVALAVPIDARRQRVGAALAPADVTVPHTNAADPDTRRAAPRRAALGRAAPIKGKRTWFDLVSACIRP